MSAAEHDPARDAELERLRGALAKSRRQWVPRIARHAVYDKGAHGWRLGDISGAAGASLLIYENKDHRTHQDFNGAAFKGDDLDLIGELCSIRDFPKTVIHAAGLVGVAVPSWEAMMKAKEKKANGGTHSNEKSDGPAIMPVPDGEPGPPGARPSAGEQHEDRHCYRDRAGKVMFYVDRFRIAATDKKRFLPWTLRRSANGSLEWTMSGPEKPVPLYGLDRLDGAEHVLLVEGEHKADVAKGIVPAGFAVLSLMGGSGKAAYQDYTALAGVPVTAWPDNDDGGRKAMATAMALAGQAGACVRGIVAVPCTFPAAWDLADVWPEPEADPEQRVRELIDGAPEWTRQDKPGLCLSIAQWQARELPPPDRLLGSCFTTDCRALGAAATGLGKTNIFMAMGIAMAAGQSFLHWDCPRQARVLFIDGEMSKRLLRSRLDDAARRLGSVPQGFFALCRDDVEDMPPLNTPEGQGFIDKVIKDIGGVDFVEFDNVQSLLIGDMKEEESWAETLPWIKSLTRRKIGQLWIHHTGHDEQRAYGTSTRLWQLDTVILLERIDRPNVDIAFTLKFTKARERTPENRADFEPVVIVLADDAWHVEGAPPSATSRKPSPKALAFHGALLDALAVSGKPRPESANRPSVTADQWKGECCRLGLIQGPEPGKKLADKERSLFNKYRLELIASRWVASNADYAWNMAVSGTVSEGG
jgi:AAA domain